MGKMTWLATQSHCPDEASGTLRLMGFLAHILRWRGRRGARLDLEVMQDHLKRDIGLMDGRDPPPDDQRF
ncbi:hypothetical protein BTR14_03475 [Rhizobium rhizosphaerae]|uniref:DUF1127 domain-containing protein n=2 Tax=Xaviernesmea rhizosphaerae TaxID=1672749 RepID=A0ABX3PHR0_9HYPH|nr:hypothetical protein BTR14_03475 [Xaviernesmea rhizosphaerae]